MGTTSLEYAQQVELAMKRAIREGRYGLKKKGERSWEDIMRNYVKKLEFEGASEKWQIAAYRYCRTIGDYLGKDRTIKEVTPEILKDFRLHLLGRGASNKKVNRCMAVGRAAWNYAVDDLPNPLMKVFFCL